MLTSSKPGVSFVLRFQTTVDKFSSIPIWIMSTYGDKLEDLSRDIERACEIFRYQHSQ